MPFYETKPNILWDKGTFFGGTPDEEFPNASFFPVEHIKKFSSMLKEGFRSGVRVGVKDASFSISESQGWL